MKEPTQQYSDTIKSLQSRIQALEDENRLLKERLEEAGVSYADIVSGDAEGVVELYDPDQGARIKKFDVTDKIASDAKACLLYTTHSPREDLQRVSSLSL